MILFDGCSWTYGCELENIEEERWSTLVSNHFNTEHVNLSRWGKSNDGILRTTMHHCENHKVDLAVIQFTKNNRREILSGDSYYRMKHGKANTLMDQASLDYYKYLNTPEDNVANFFKNKFLLEHYFKVHKIPYVFVKINLKTTKYYSRKHSETDSVNPSSWQMMSDSSPVPCLYDVLGGWNIPPYYDYETYRKQNVKKEGTHPNAKGHRKIADFLISIIDREKYLQT